MTPTEQSGNFSSLAAVLCLEPHGPDTYVGGGPQYPFTGLYGGQVVAQALQAAQLSVKAGYAPHSLHAYFIRMGDPAEPVRFEVQRLRDGHSFIAREVVARQSAGAILNMSASFQAVIDEANEWGSVPRKDVASPPPPPTDIQLERPPAVGGPDDGKDASWSPLFEMRVVQGSYGEAWGRAPGQSSPATPAWSWMRVTEQLPDEAAAHAAALAYESDSGPAWVVDALHEAIVSPGHPWRPISLDHAMWFHRPFRADEWLLLSTSAASLRASRGLAVGQVWSPDGVLVASVSQEVLLRRPRSTGPIA
ncbi:MAG: acyl-CoA thioesterase [Acidimicrobiales bacterium]